MNVSVPFDHASVPPEQGAEKSRVRGRYVSVEYVREVDGGERVEWLMATSSCAGGEWTATCSRGRLSFHFVAQDRFRNS